MGILYKQTGNWNWLRKNTDSSYTEFGRSFGETFCLLPSEEYMITKITVNLTASSKQSISLQLGRPFIVNRSFAWLRLQA